MRKVFFTLLMMLPMLLSAQIGVLKIYGGSDHQTYLGKFNAPANDPESIWNQNGKFGNSKEELSIWNQNGKYGNAESAFSPWGEMANERPVLRDQEGNEMPFNAESSNEQVQFVCLYHASIIDGSYTLQYWFNTIFADTYEEEYDMKYFAPKEMLQ